jgi:hypothetical protein
VREAGLPDVTRIMYQLWLERGDLREVFDLNEVEGRFAFHTWFAQQGPIEAGIDEPSLAAAAALAEAVGSRV